MSLMLKRAFPVAAFAVLLAASLGLANAATVHVRLSGRHEVPPVKTLAWGSGVLSVSADGTVSGRIKTHGIRGTMAHIHLGAPGTNGPPIIALAPGPNGTWVVPAGSRLTPQQYQSFLAGDLYVNVHSRKHPGGVIRAQLRP